MKFVNFLLILYLLQKNALNKKIIIYHWDERKGVVLCKLFFDKGYDNVFLVNGGIEAFVELYPEFCEGDKVPFPVK